MGLLNSTNQDNDYWSAYWLLTPIYLITLILGNAGETMMIGSGVNQEKSKYRITATFRLFCISVWLLVLGLLLLFGRAFDQNLDSSTSGQRMGVLAVLFVVFAFLAIFPFIMFKVGKKKGLVVKLG
jgi:hypothetical protein